MAKQSNEPRHSIEYVNFNVGADGSFQTARIGSGDGEQKIVAIAQHDPRGPGDMWFYDVIRKDGSFVRIFNPCQVGYTKPSSLIVPDAKRLVS